MANKFGACILNSATLHGVEVVPVSVEVVVSDGMPAFHIVGMPDAAIREAYERIRAACRACGFVMPSYKIVVNLAPSSMRKAGSGFDLPIAIALLAATGQIDKSFVENSVIIGELSLDGSVRTVPGQLAFAMSARKQERIFVCSADSQGTIPVRGLKVQLAKSLSDFRECNLSEARVGKNTSQIAVPDFRDIAGHNVAKRALQIAAAGGHGVLMMGPPGSGKTMLASRLPSILPPLTEKECLETAVIHSVANEPIEAILGGVRPFRNPYHSATLAGLVGGGTPVRPGEIALAHNGVLFLDELSEFKSAVLQGIRQPMETGYAVITRADGTYKFPSKFVLIAASNPCPCGYYGDDQHVCRCTLSQVRTYQNRIGGPIMDRINIHLNVARLPSKDVLNTGSGTSSESLREGVLTAREFDDWLVKKYPLSKSLGPTEKVLATCRMNNKTRTFLDGAVQDGNMSGRAIMGVLSVARTVANLQKSECVEVPHLCEALMLRVRDREELT